MLTATRTESIELKERGFTEIKPNRTDLMLLWGEEERPAILLVEDDPKIALALKIRLANEGYDVIQASDAALGLMCVADEQRRPNVVLLDLMLPGVDGATVAEVLKEHENTRDLPVIFMTGSRDPQLRNRARSLAPVAFLDKPFDFPRLLDAIEESI